MGDASEVVSPLDNISLFSGRPLAKLLRFRYDTSKTFFGQAGQRRLDAARIELRVGFDSVTFVENDDCTRGRAFHDLRRDLSRIAPHGIQSANAPSNERQISAFQLGMKKETFYSGRSPKELRRSIRPGPEVFDARRDFSGGSNWARSPNASGWMRVGVVRDAVAARDDLCHQVRIFFRVPTDHEKGGASVEAIEQVENGDSVSGRRPVVDREPDFLVLSREGTCDGTKPLAVRRKDCVEEEQMAADHWSEGDPEICAEK